MFEYFVFSMYCFFAGNSFCCSPNGHDNHEEIQKNAKEITIEDLKKRYGNDFIEQCERHIYEQWQLHAVSIGGLIRLFTGQLVLWEEMDESKKRLAVSHLLCKYSKLYMDDERQLLYIIPTLNPMGIFTVCSTLYAAIGCRRRRVEDECDN